MRITVSKTIAADLITPVSAFLSVASDEPHAFLLESVEGGEHLGRFTFLGARPYMILSARGKKITITRGRTTELVKEDLLPTMKRIFAENRVAPVPGLPPFTSGAVGYLAYDFVRNLERLPERAKADIDVPDCTLMFFDRVLAFDHVRHEIHLIATCSPREKKAAERDLAALERKLGAGIPASARRAPKQVRGKLKVTPTTSKQKFLRDVARIQEYIAAGDVFQTVLSQRLEFEPGVPPFQIYRALRAVNPSPYMYYLRMGQDHIAGSSPEMLVKASAGKLNYRPIAGTRWRGVTETEDQQLERDLLADEKERAEHVMLVDLGRNDLGRVSQPGTVRVKDLMHVERYSHVMHLVSALEGKLRPELTPLDAFVSCFPAGTLTGAPKVRAMQIIEELEPVRRGVYGGSVFYADFAGNLDSCIAIRSMFMRGKKAYVQAGAGIVADSVPEREYDECLNKAQALLRAVEKARHG
jgi:anthranilate synthase component I